jgi:16S rRNA processing protein RimM
MIKKDDLFKIGQFTKPHGIKGEISLLTDYVISDISGVSYIICDMDGILVPFFVNSHRQKSSASVLFSFKNIDSEEKVKILSGKTAYIRSDLLPPEDEEDISWNNLTGYSVIDEKSGSIGQVADIDDSTMNILLKVDLNGNETLIPVALVTDIDQESKAMYVSLPEGFSEI